VEANIQSRWHEAWGRFEWSVVKGLWPTLCSSELPSEAVERVCYVQLWAKWLISATQRVMRVMRSHEKSES
jgi:hypothetical protein